jgi:hypothetical protein
MNHEWNVEKRNLIRAWSKATGRPSKEWFDAYASDHMPLGCGSNPKHRAIVRKWFKEQL